MPNSSFPEINFSSQHFGDVAVAVTRCLNHHYNVVPDHFHHPRRSPTPIKQPLPSVPLVKFVLLRQHKSP